jgi:hypothetical protein
MVNKKPPAYAGGLRFFGFGCVEGLFLRGDKPLIGV